MTGELSFCVCKSLSFVNAGEKIFPRSTSGYDDFTPDGIMQNNFASYRFVFLFMNAPVLMQKMCFPLSIKDHGYLLREKKFPLRTKKYSFPEKQGQYGKIDRHGRQENSCPQPLLMGGTPDIFFPRLTDFPKRRYDRKKGWKSCSARSAPVTLPSPAASVAGAMRIITTGHAAGCADFFRHIAQDIKPQAYT